MICWQFFDARHYKYLAPNGAGLGRVAWRRWARSMGGDPYRPRKRGSAPRVATPSASLARQRSTLEFLIDRNVEEPLDIICLPGIVALIPVGRVRRTSIEDVIDAES
jgi:hypothetical protein